MPPKNTRVSGSSSRSASGSRRKSMTPGRSTERRKSNSSHARGAEVREESIPRASLSRRASAGAIRRRQSNKNAPGRDTVNSSDLGKPSLSVNSRPKNGGLSLLDNAFFIIVLALLSVLGMVSDFSVFMEVRIYDFLVLPCALEASRSLISYRDL